MTARASVVMATHGRRAWLPDVLAPLLADPATGEVVVVVDGSRDGSLELLEDMAARDPRVRPVWTENVGAAAAQQLGVEAAREDLVVLFDDDQIAEPGMVSRHVERHRAHDDPAALLVVGYVHTAPPAVASRGSFVVDRYVESYERDVAAYADGSDAILAGLWGGNLSMRRDALLRIGWANPGFPYRYHYDEDFGLRCRAAGVHAVHDRSIRAEHRFERTVDAYFAGARERGRGLAAVEREHPELAADYGMGGAPTARQRLLLAPPAFAVIRRGLRAAVAAAGVAGRHGAEDAIARRLWWLELRAAYLSERRRLGRD